MLGVNSFRAILLIKFDLAGLAGRKVTGNVSLQLYLTDGVPGGTQILRLRESKSNWSEATTTWNNIPGGMPTGTLGSVDLDSQSVTFNSNPRDITFTIPASVVQGWIDSPSTNQGLSLISNSAGGSNDLLFGSRESTNPPKLSFGLAASGDLVNNDLSPLVPRFVSDGMMAGESLGTPHLASLDLSSHPGTSTDVSCAFSTLTELKSLKLTGTSVDPIGSSTLNTLSGLTNLQTLTLPVNVLSPIQNLVANEGVTLSLPDQHDGR